MLILLNIKTESLLVQPGHASGRSFMKSFYNVLSDPAYTHTSTLAETTMECPLYEAINPLTFPVILVLHRQNALLSFSVMNHNRGRESADS